MTPQTELERIAREQSIEQQWWGHLPRFLHETDVIDATSCGQLVRVHDGANYRVSANIPPQYRVLTYRAYQLLVWIALKWSQELGGEEKMFLVVSSLTRPTIYQRMLIKRGFPAVENSSHERGLAFDISVDWFERRAPHASRALWSVIENAVEHGMANAIQEPTVRVYHVATSPRFLNESTRRLEN